MGGGGWGGGGGAGGTYSCYGTQKKPSLHITWELVVEELSWCWYGEWSWERRGKTNVSGLAYIGISCCSVRLLRHHWLCCLSSKVRDPWQRGKQNIICLKSQLLIKFKEEESKTMSQVLLMAYKIQRGNQNKSLLSLDDLGTTFQRGKQNKLSQVLMDYNISHRTGKTMSLSSLDGLQHFRLENKTIFPKSWCLTTFQTEKQNKSLSSLDASQHFRQERDRAIIHWLWTSKRKTKNPAYRKKSMQTERKKKSNPWEMERGRRVARRACKQRKIIEQNFRSALALVFARNVVRASGMQWALGESKALI